jgi:hypothetical protein
MALLTLIGGERMAIVPAHSHHVEAKKVVIKPSKGDKQLEYKNVELVVGPEGKSFEHTRRSSAGEKEYFMPRMHPNQGLAFIFLTILLLVITITNVPLRGLWSVIIIIVLVLGSIIMAQLDLWSFVIDKLHLLAVHINMAAYVCFSLVLFVIWLINVVFFDPQLYVVFTPGQVRVRQSIGGGEVAYDTVGMAFHKQRSDLFRHWILGFGSGDLVLRPAGKEPIEMHNVLNVGRRVKQIEALLKEREVVASPS